ncbi:MAG: DUF2071 domain-containing protein [Verrucomicrobiota bacterium]
MKFRLSGFRADWRNLLMIHFAVLPERLQSQVPLPLDTYNGEAFVSLVFFRQENLSLWRAGDWTRILLRPLSDHHFVNLRTYVKVGQEVGIYFLREWIDNWPGRIVGPLTYGLPYRLGRHFQNNEEEGTFEALLRAGPNRLQVRARYKKEAKPAAPEGTLFHFLHERYHAYTKRLQQTLRFTVEHPPWEMKKCEVNLQAHGPDLDILRSGCLVESAYTCGFRGVHMSFPKRV